MPKSKKETSGSKRQAKKKRTTNQNDRPQSALDASEQQVSGTKARGRKKRTTIQQDMPKGASKESDDDEGGKPGNKNKLSTIQNDLLEAVFVEYYDILEESGVIDLKPGAHLPRNCSEFASRKRLELLATPPFADLDEADLAIAKKTIQVAFYNYKRQRFRPIWLAKHGNGSNNAPDKSSSAASTMPLLDKLCSGTTGRDLFQKEFQEPIGKEIERVRADRISTGEGTLNTAGIYQEVKKKMWELLPPESKDELEKKAQTLNSDIETNRNNYLKLVKCSHQSMLDGGRLGKSSVMITFLICEDDNDSGDLTKAYSIMSGIDKDVVIPGRVEFMRGLSSFFGNLVVDSAQQSEEVKLKMPENSQGRVFLPPFDPTVMQLAELQVIMKTFFRDAWEQAYGPPTMDLPGPPWMAIEKYPEDYYIPDSLCVPLRMPDTMTQQELVKIVQQLTSISPESHDHFCFFPKEVIERNMEVRGVIEEEWSRAGEELMEIDTDLSANGSPESNAPGEMEMAYSTMEVDTDFSANGSPESNAPGKMEMALSTNMVTTSWSSETLTNPSPLVKLSTDTVNVTSQSLFPYSSSTDSSVPTAYVTTPRPRPHSASIDPVPVTATVVMGQCPDISPNVSSSLTNPTVAAAEPSRTLSTYLPLVLGNPPTAQIPLTAAATLATSQSTTIMPSDQGNNNPCPSLYSDVQFTAPEQAFHSSTSDDLSAYWANFERWLGIKNNGAEALNSDITMSDVDQVNVWEGVDVNLSNDWLDQSIPEQQASLPPASLPLSHCESLPDNGSVPSFALPHNEPLPKLTSLPHEPQSVLDSTSSVPLQRESLPFVPDEQQYNTLFLHEQQTASSVPLQHESLPFVPDEQRYNAFFPHEQQPASSVPVTDFPFVILSMTYSLSSVDVQIPVSSLN